MFVLHEGSVEKERQTRSERDSVGDGADLMVTAKGR